MAGTQALDASRTPAFTYEPDALILVTKPGERFYSPTVEDPIPDGDVLDAVSRGIKLSLLVRKTAHGDVVVAGRQRTKRALVVNHILGVKKYDGPIKSVRDTIARIKGTPIEERIIEIGTAKWPKGLMLRAFAENGGSDLDAEAAGIAEDEIRRGGSGQNNAIRAARARQLSESGYPIDKIAETMRDVSIVTLRRWINKDPGGKAKAGKRGKATRPGAAKLKKVIERAEAANLAQSAIAALQWAAGDITDDQFFDVYPRLAEKKTADKAEASGG
jgi:hypothetical protein